jgi:serine O-acetyltransferase
VTEHFDTNHDRSMASPVSIASVHTPPSPSEPEPPTSSRRQLSQRAREEVPLWQLIREDLQCHGGEWTRPGFQALAVYRFGVWRMGIGPKFLRAPLSVLYRTLFEFVRNFYGIELPYSAKIGRRVVFEHQHGIVVHGDTVIGDECIIRQGVTLGLRRLTHRHDAPVLGRAVNVGAGAKILGNIHIGDNAEIGANAVVLEDVPSGALAVGVPARARRRPREAKAPSTRRGNGARPTRNPHAEA